MKLMNQTIIDAIDFGNIKYLLRLPKKSQLIILFKSKNKVFERIVLFYLLKQQISVIFQTLYSEKIFQKTSLMTDQFTDIVFANHFKDDFKNHYFKMRIQNYYYEKLFGFCSILTFIDNQKNINKNAHLYIRKNKIINTTLSKKIKRNLTLYTPLNFLNDDEYRWTYNAKEKKNTLDLLKILFHIIRNILFNSPLKLHNITINFLTSMHQTETKHSLLNQRNIINKFNEIGSINLKLKFIYNSKKYKIKRLPFDLYKPFLKHLLNFKGIIPVHSKIGLIEKLNLFNDWILSFFIKNFIIAVKAKVFYSNLESPLSSLFHEVCKQTNCISMAYSFSAGYFPIKNSFSHQRKNVDIFFVWGKYFSELFKKSFDNSKYHVLTGSPIDNFLPLPSKHKMKIFDKPYILYCDNTFGNDLQINKKNALILLSKIANIAVKKNVYLVIKVKKDICIYNNLLKKYPDNIFLDQKKGDLSLFFNSEVTIAYSLSSMPLIASELNKKIILLQYEDNWSRQYPFYNNFVEKNEISIIKKINSLLTSKIDQEKINLSDINTYNDGKSMHRITKYIELIIHTSFEPKDKIITHANKKFKNLFGHDKII